MAKMAKKWQFGPKNQCFGPRGAYFGRLGALRLFAGLRGSSEYLYALLGCGVHWNPLQMAKKAKNGHLGLKINVLGPGGADFGRLGALGFFRSYGSSEYLYVILGWGSIGTP